MDRTFVGLSLNHFQFITIPFRVSIAKKYFINDNILNILRQLFIALVNIQ